MAERMLIIDDAEAVLKSCSEIFTAEGFDVVITRSPQEGLRRASDSYFDVILCDWRMLGLDEMDLVEELDRRSPDSTLVMVDGYPTVDHATEVMKRGAMDYIAKPFTPEEIINAVKRAANRKAAEERKVMRRFVSFVEVLLNARNDKEQK